MRIFKRQSHLPYLAHSVWKPNRTEKDALLARSHVAELGRVDQLWEWLKENHSDLTAVEAPHGLCPESFTYGQLADRISKAAATLSSFGIGKGDVVAFFAENGPRWLIVDQAIMRVGASNAVRGATAPVEELRYILEDSGAVALVVQSAELLERLSLTGPYLKTLRVVVQLEGKPVEGVLGLDKLIDLGEGKQPIDVMLDRGVDSSAASVATILYTSGTTGRPKGVPLTHANLLHQMRSLACVANPSAGSPVLSVLPIWHSYERSAEYYFFSCGCTQSYTTIKHLKNDLPRVRPVVMATVPRLWEAVKAGFDDAVTVMPPIRRQLLRVALANSGAFKVAKRTFRSLLLEPVPPTRRLWSLCEMVVRWPMHFFSSIVLWPKVVNRLCGGQLLFPINGGGAIAQHVDFFFEALGIELLVGYGLTETSPVVTCRRPWKNRRGSSGTPLPETEIRIIDPETGSTKRFYQRGIVFVKGPQVMSGYLGKPEASVKVLDSEGWFNTGDLGLLLPDGSLVLTGRAKDTIVLSNGENVEPGPLEETLLGSQLFDQIMLVGQDEKQLGALVVPNAERMLTWANAQGLALSKGLGRGHGNLDLRKLLRREINSLLAKRSGSRLDERVAGVALVDPFTIDNGLLTQTLKQRRDRIEDRDCLAISSIFEK